MTCEGAWAALGVLRATLTGALAALALAAPAPATAEGNRGSGC